MNRTIADLQKRAAALNVQLTATEARYKKQFTALDTLIGKMNTTSSFLSQQLANLPSLNGN
jgi:flagellar hook-associated protein 2